MGAELKVRSLVRVPDVAGQPLHKARLIIENAGLVVDAVLFRESYEPKNLVLEQKPARGQMIYAGDGVTVWVARKGYGWMLPAIYRRSDPLGRNVVRDVSFILEHLFGGVEDILDDLHRTFDPHECDERFLPWLAGWMAMILDPEWPIEKQRALVKKAIQLYGLRGTKKGLSLFLELFTGHRPIIHENQWPFKGFRIGTVGAVGVDSVILPPVNLGHCFVVEMPIKFTDLSSEMVVRIHQVIQMEKPAHTHYYLRFAAEPTGWELREFFSIGLRSGIGIGAEVVGVDGEAGDESEKAEKA